MTELEGQRWNDDRSPQERNNSSPKDEQRVQHSMGALDGVAFVLGSDSLANTIKQIQDCDR